MKEINLPFDHLLLDRSPNIRPHISRWELDKFKNCWNKSFRSSKILTLLYQQFSNLLISQRDMSSPRLGALSYNRWFGGIWWRFYFVLKEICPVNDSNRLFCYVSGRTHVSSPPSRWRPSGAPGTRRGSAGASCLPTLSTRRRLSSWPTTTAGWPGCGTLALDGAWNGCRLLVPCSTGASWLSGTTCSYRWSPPAGWPFTS